MLCIHLLPEIDKTMDFCQYLCPSFPEPGVSYHADVTAQGGELEDYALCNKRQVVQFVQEWCRTVNDAFWEDKTISAFLEVSGSL